MKEKYDVIIIGAGIGGLVCGCYLAKAGLKTLIVEQHFKVGGYCTSFTRKGFTFEAGAIEDLNPGSNFRKIIDELNITQHVKIIRTSPHILIFTPEGTIKLGINKEEIIDTLQRHCPGESLAIQKFIDFVDEYNITRLYLYYRKKTLDALLNEYFCSDKAKNLIRTLCSQLGAPSHLASALSAATYLKTFILGGGYYPKGGLQAFADAFMKQFIAFGGNIRYSSLAKKIIIYNKQARGIELNSGECIRCRYVVSNADATDTFKHLVGPTYLDSSFINKIVRLKPSLSAFIVYLGIKKQLKKKFRFCHEIWKTHHKKSEISSIFCYMPSFCDSSLAPHNCESISIGTLTTKQNKSYWHSIKNTLSEKLIRQMQGIMRFSDKDIAVREIAVPHTLYRYTLNRNGAYKGWAPLISQVDINTMSTQTPIRSLYLAGHWVTTGVGESGIPQAAYSGNKTAELILKSKKR